MLGNFFSPITGVLIADHIVMKRCRIDLAKLFQENDINWYWRAFNPIAIA